MAKKNHPTKKPLSARRQLEKMTGGPLTFGALHVRLVPGFVTDTRLEPGARIVTFGNGVVARETIIDVDDSAMRIAWSASGGRLSHHNASAQVFADVGGGSRVVWICDLLPNEMRATIDGMISQGMAAMKRTLDQLGQ